MAGLVPAIHVFCRYAGKTWMPATSAGMATESDRFVRSDGERAVGYPQPALMPPSTV